MKDSIQRVFRCDYCNKITTNKGAMVIHERSCKKNPKNIPLCHECYWMKEEGEKTFRYTDPGWDECCPWNGRRSYTMNVKMCEFRNRGMYWKANEKKEETIKGQSDWFKCPMKTDTCEGYLTWVKVLEIEKELKLGNFNKLTPEIYKEYLKNNK